MPLPEKHILSKSTFMYGNQCMKRLWLHKFNPAVRDEEDEAQTAIFQSGTDVGLLAQKRYYGGVDASPVDAFHYQQSVYDTANLIAKGAKVIYEAAFQFDGVLAAMDMLVKRKDKWYAYEVKASTSVKEPFLHDAALQYYVITKSGLPLEDIFILHLNNEYTRYGDLDLQQLFTPTSVLEEVKKRQASIAAKILDLKIMLKLKLMPDITMGEQCNKPYACDFQGYCSEGMELEISDYGNSNIDKEGIAEFIDSLKYPLYFLDFETWMTAVPEKDGQWPYRQMPFQFSVHIQNKKGDKVNHVEYLAENKNCDLRIFVEELMKALGDEGSIVVYNKAFENTRLRELKEQFEEHNEVITAIQERLVDGMDPFRKKHYYLPEMEGSYSIKYVLPAMFPELSYTELEIANGIDASAAFYNLDKEEDATVVAETRKALLEYCKMDTWAMVKILERLIEEVNN